MALDPIMFADDTTLFHSNKNINSMFETVNKALVNITSWFHVNKLSLNANKTKYVLFHKPRKKIYIPLSLPLLETRFCKQKKYHEEGEERKKN